MNRKCQCLFSQDADTIRGTHRDPIASEKSWLDYAVRELSRVAAGKDRGRQEAVWRIHCKPLWWDEVCSHPWKNPTANPKDSKDTLRSKFGCLLQHLKKEGKVPVEMEEEISLWKEGNLPKIFLMTSFSSAINHVSSVHSMLCEIRHKMEATDVALNSSVMDDLQHCLLGCLKELDLISNVSSKQHRSDRKNELKLSNHSPRKRVSERKDATPEEQSCEIPIKIQRNDAFSFSTLPSTATSVDSASFIPSPSFSLVAPSNNSLTKSLVDQPVNHVNCVDSEHQKIMCALVQKMVSRKEQQACSVTQIFNSYETRVKENTLNNNKNKIKVSKEGQISGSICNVLQPVSTVKSDNVPITLGNKEMYYIDEVDFLGPEFDGSSIASHASFSFMDNFLENSRNTPRSSKLDHSLDLKSVSHPLESPSSKKEKLSAQQILATHGLTERNIAASSLLQSKDSWAAIPVTLSDIKIDKMTGSCIEPDEELYDQDAHLIEEAYILSDNGYSSDSSHSVMPASADNSPLDQEDEILLSSFDFLSE